MNEKITDLILGYGMIAGEHHKQWLLDQTLKLVLGDSYHKIIADYNSDPEYENWDVGIPP